VKKNLWIVGGGSAVGKALAKRLCVDYQIIILHRKAGDQIAEDGSIKETIELTDLHGLEEAIIRINSLFPPSAIVFAQRYRPLLEEADHFDLALKTEVQSSALILKIIGQSHSLCLTSVLFLTSVVNRLVNKKQPLWYHVTKSAQVAMTKYLAVTKTGASFNVNAIELSSFLKYPIEDYTQTERTWFGLLQKHSPMSEVLVLNQLADVAAFMISDAARMLNGQVITLDGGTSNIAQEILIG
jgi:NAD(P)-dependent dehydrogenase (short-subunit alcohol dehydrogenase family)